MQFSEVPSFLKFIGRKPSAAVKIHGRNGLQRLCFRMDSDEFCPAYRKLDGAECCSQAVDFACDSPVSGLSADTHPTEISVLFGTWCCGNSVQSRLNGPFFARCQTSRHGSQNECIMNVPFSLKLLRPVPSDQHRGVRPPAIRGVAAECRQNMVSPLPTTSLQGLRPNKAFRCHLKPADT